MALTKVNTDLLEDGGKLDGIEAGADVTDTTNVTAAGALMDSELTSEASVKALNQGVATGDSPTFVGINASSDLTLDVAGDIVLNADGGDWKFQDASASILEVQNDGNGNAVIITPTSDKDIKFLGNDGGSTITALTLDMSAAGAATFNAGATFNGTATMDAATVQTASNEEDALLIKQSDGTDVGSLRINNGSFLLKGKSASQPVQIQSHDGNEDIEIDPDGFIKMETAGSERLRINANGSVGIGVADGDVTGDGTAARTYVGIIGTGNRGRLNIGSTASNGADSGVISFVNGANELGAINMETNSGSQTVGKMYITSSDLLTINSAGGVVFNDNSVDADFRVESDTNTHALFVNAGNSRVGINDDNPVNTLQITEVDDNNSNNSIYNADFSSGPMLKIANPYSGAVPSAQQTKIAGVKMVTVSNGGYGAHSQMHVESKDYAGFDAGDLVFSTGANSSSLLTERLRLNKAEAVFNDVGADVDFRVESDTGTHMLFVDAGGGYVTVGRETNLGSSVLTVQSNNNAGLAIGYGTGTNEYRRLYHHSSGLYFESSTNQAYLNAAGVWVDASDITYKKEIEDIDYGIETVKKLKPRKYKMKSDDTEQIGFVAQELVEQVPEIVSEKDGILGVAYGQLTAVLTKAIQEQQELIKTLEARITALES